MAGESLLWRIYYDDGGTFSSADGTPACAPPFGVVAIVQPEPTVKRVIASGFDWYYYVDSEQQWWGGDLAGVLDRMLHRKPVEYLLMGRSVDHATYHEIMRRADEDPDFRGCLKGDRA